MFNFLLLEFEFLSEDEYTKKDKLIFYFLYLFFFIQKQIKRNSVNCEPYRGDFSPTLLFPPDDYRDFERIKVQKEWIFIHY